MYAACKVQAVGVRALFAEGVLSLEDGARTRAERPWFRRAMRGWWWSKSDADVETARPDGAGAGAVGGPPCEVGPKLPPSCRPDPDKSAAPASGSARAAYEHAAPASGGRALLAATPAPRRPFTPWARKATR